MSYEKSNRHPHRYRKQQSSRSSEVSREPKEQTTLFRVHRNERLLRPELKRQLRFVGESC